MKNELTPIENDNRKEGFVRRIEELIISGYFPIGIRLPPERELAAMLEVSRPMVREGLVELQQMGLVSMKPRSGTVVNDYRREGSISLLTAIFRYEHGRPESGLLSGIMDMRRLVEVESARLAAMNRPDSILKEFGEILAFEVELPGEEGIPARVENDFRFHHLVAIATGNPVYPLHMNSYKPLYLNLAGAFYTDPEVSSDVEGFHAALVEAIEAKDPEQAEKVMDAMLAHGEEHLSRMLAGSKEDQV